MRLERRALLCSSLLGTGTLLSPPASSTTPPERLERLSTSVRGAGDAGISSWGQPWSNACSWSAKPVVLDAQAALPAWLEGRWRVTSSMDGASFPLGRKFLSETMPGVRMASILPLPNIGNTPTFELEFTASTGGDVVPARGANAARVLEAWWPSAKVLDVETPSIGRLLLRYEGPTRSKGRVAQSVDLQVCASEGGPVQQTASVPAGGGGEWITSEVFQQDSIEQGIRGEFQVINAFSRGSAANTVRCRQRVAAFLQPTDGAYFDALGKPVALYDYTFTLTRI